MRNAAVSAGTTGRSHLRRKTIFEKQKTASSVRRKNGLGSGFVVLDVETTGLDIRNDVLTEIGAILVENGEIRKEYHVLVNIGEHPLPDEVIRLNGLTRELLAEKGVDPKEAIEGLRDFIGTSTVVGYNILAFDSRVLSIACRRAGIQNSLKKREMYFLPHASDCGPWTIIHCMMSRVFSRSNFLFVSIVRLTTVH